MRAAAEETVNNLLESSQNLQFGEEPQSPEPPRLIVVMRTETALVEMEFMAVLDEESLQERLANLSDEAEGLEEGEISLRLLRHHASSVNHQKYHGLDIVTVQVKGFRSPTPPLSS